MSKTIMDAVTRVLKAINHEEPDRVPAFESAFTNNTLSNYHGVPVKPANLGFYKVVPYIPFINKIVKKGNESKAVFKSQYSKLFKVYRQAKLDISPCVVDLFPKKMVKGGFIDEYGRHMQMESYKGDGTLILGYKGGHLGSFEDWESWDHPDPSDGRRLTSFFAAKEVQEEMNNEVMAVPFTGSLMEVSWEGFGIETFSRILAHPKQAQRIFDNRGKFTLEMVKILSENGAKIIGLWDDYGYKNGLFMSPRNYRKYVFPWIRKICAAAHKNGSKILLHSDGDLMKIFEDIIDAGVDVLNPIEATTANPDYDIFKLNEKYGGKITFCGNISPMMLATGEISEIEEYSKRLIRELAPGGGYIFSSGHSINPAVTIDRWQAVLDIREKYGMYPINVPK